MMLNLNKLRLCTVDQILDRTVWLGMVLLPEYFVFLAIQISE